MSITRDEALRLVDMEPYRLITLPSRFLGDKDIVMTAVSKPGCGVYALYADYSVATDKDVILLAIKNGLRLVHGIPYQDKDVVLAALSKHPEDVKYAREDLRPSRQELKAAQKDPPKRLRRDYPMFGPELC